MCVDKLRFLVKVMHIELIELKEFIASTKQFKHEPGCHDFVLM
jgi:hypothetical protein